MEFVFCVCFVICNFVPKGIQLQNREDCFGQPKFRLDNEGDCAVGRIVEEVGSIHTDANLDNIHFYN